MRCWPSEGAYGSSVEAAPSHEEKVSDALAQKAKASPVDELDVIVTFKVPPGQFEKAQVRRHGAKVKRHFRSIPAMALRLPARAVQALAKRPNVNWVTIDVPIQLHAKGVKKDEGGDEPPSYVAPTGGDGVTVAVVDSGIQGAHADLAGKIVADVNFVSDSATSNSSHDDRWGHGTHVAGLIAGSGAASNGLYTGVAPGADLVNVRVIEQGGAGLTSEVIAGIDWVIENKDTYGIRVMNLSLGHTIIESADVDPLVLAVEQAWDAGIVVVTSAGNYGRDGFFTITSPGNSRKVITVGSLTDYRNADPDDDIVSTYSSQGPTLIDHYAKPDLLAPGNKIVSLRAANSLLDKEFPGNRIGDDYFMLSGTSMAAPQVVGAVALMPEKDDSLSPDTVKGRLMISAQGFADHPMAAGTGVLDIPAALASDHDFDSALSPQLIREPETDMVSVEDTADLWIYTTRGNNPPDRRVLAGRSLVRRGSLVGCHSVVRLGSARRDRTVV